MCRNTKKNDNFLIVEELQTEEMELSYTSNQEINISSIIYTFDELREKMRLKETDYLELHKFQIEIGKLGEAFVYELECEKLSGTKYDELVDNTKALDPNNGYDILSYEIDGTKIHIEVKTTAVNKAEFFLTSYEYNTAKRMKENGERYYIYRVSNILAKYKKDVKCKIIYDILEDGNYIFEEVIWKVRKIVHTNYE